MTKTVTFALSVFGPQELGRVRSMTSISVEYSAINTIIIILTLNCSDEEGKNDGFV